MRRVLIGVLALVFALGCSQRGMNSRIETSTEVAPSVDMAAYKTWNFARTDNPLSGIPILDDATFRAEVVQNLDRDMAARGLNRVNDASSDLKLMMHVMASQNFDEVVAENREYDFASLPEGSSWEEGSLTVFLFDKAGKLVWQGNAAGTLAEDLTPRQYQQNFKKVLSGLVAQIPMGGAAPTPAN